MTADAEIGDMDLIERAAARMDRADDLERPAPSGPLQQSAVARNRQADKYVPNGFH